MRVKLGALVAQPTHLSLQLKAIQPLAKQKGATVELVGAVFRITDKHGFVQHIAWYDRMVVWLNKMGDIDYES